LRYSIYESKNQLLARSMLRLLPRLY